MLRLASNGIRTRKLAELLELGEETVRGHIKKSQTKLGARDRLHTVAEALRLELIRHSAGELQCQTQRVETKIAICGSRR